MKKEIDQIVKEAVSIYDNKTDFELREELIGCGFTAAHYSRQFYEVGTENYKILCSKLTDILSGKLKKAYKGVKKFAVEIDYKSKNKDTIFGYSCTCEERNIEEVKERIKQKKFQDLHTRKRIKPIFVKFDIKEVLQ